MLKTSASFVLGSSKSSTYPQGYASGFDSPAALLDGHFEHPAGDFSCCTERGGEEFEAFETSNRAFLARHASQKLADRAVR
jgi:hypothetical protein